MGETKDGVMQDDDSQCRESQLIAPRGNPDSWGTGNDLNSIAISDMIVSTTDGCAGPSVRKKNAIT